MVTLFNEKFNSKGIGEEELRVCCEEVQRALDSRTLDAEKPGWAKNTNEISTVVQMAARGRSSGRKWKEGEDQFLDECGNRNMSWEQFAEELQGKFGINRSPGALHARCKSHH